MFDAHEVRHLHEECQGSHRFSGTASMRESPPQPSIACHLTNTIFVPELARCKNYLPYLRCLQRALWAPGWWNITYASSARGSALATLQDPYRYRTRDAVEQTTPNTRSPEGGCKRGSRMSQAWRSTWNQLNCCNMPRTEAREDRSDLKDRLRCALTGSLMI